MVLTEQQAFNITTSKKKDVSQDLIEIFLSVLDILLTSTIAEQIREKQSLQIEELWKKLILYENKKKKQKAK